MISEKSYTVFKMTYNIMFAINTILKKLQFLLSCSEQILRHINILFYSHFPKDVRKKYDDSTLSPSIFMTFGVRSVKKSLFISVLYILYYSGGIHSTRVSWPPLGCSIWHSA